MRHAAFSEKVDPGHERKGTAFHSVAIEELETGDAGFVEHVPDVVRKIGVDGCSRDGNARGPFVGECIDVNETSVA